MEKSSSWRNGKPKPRAELFWMKVQKTETCWLWMAAHDKQGYGRFQVGGGRLMLAHRFAYELLVGPIPEGLDLDHLCRNPPCVRPMHLEPVTRAENIHRSPLTYLKTHCVHGHPRIPENMAPNGPGKRPCCRVCRDIRNRARKAG